MTDTKIAVVTGASRGVGKGVAIALGSKGYTVYVTGRTLEPGAHPLPGTIHETAEAVNQAGGRGIAVHCDHASDDDARALFERVRDEAGRLDVLVNNVAHIHEDLLKPGGFWEKSLHLVDIIDVGLRSQYVASYYAAPLMIPRRRGLIVNVSFYGAVCYFHGPAYGAQKAGVDKMAADMAVDLKPYNVASVSIWLGLVATERAAIAIKGMPDRFPHGLAGFESPQFTGLVIDALYEDPLLMSRSGHVLIGAEIAAEYGLRDINGDQPASYRDTMGSPRPPHPAVFA
jgi:NAD(P)-dependent dehydrogenase (short-subunit alcohol dehydrogenase family)